MSRRRYIASDTLPVVPLHAAQTRGVYLPHELQWVNANEPSMGVWWVLGRVEIEPKGDERCLVVRC